MLSLENNHQINSYSKKLKYSIDVLIKNRLFDGVIFSPSNKNELVEFLNHYREKKKYQFIDLKNKILIKELDPRKWN